MRKQPSRNSPEQGVALILALLLILVLGILAATVMFTSQAQIWTSVNYRLEAQSRYAAESGVQRTMNWLASSSYTAPTSFGSYTTTTNPVQYGGKAVMLSALSGVSSNYPDSAVATAYNTALSSQSVPGITNATYSTYATLLRMNPVSGVSWLGGTGGVEQTWQITSVGSIAGVPNSSVQVVATYERTATPLFNYAVEALGTGCKALDFAGTDYTDSYNSNNGAYSGTNSQASGGNIASNGNVYLGSGANIKGTISDPNTVVGACPDGITSSGTYSGKNTLTANLSVPLPWGCTSTPCYPNPLPPTTAQDVSTSCGSISGCTSNSTTVINDNGTKTTVNQYTLSPGNYGNLTVANADVVYLSAGTYDVNSLNFSKDGQIVITSGPVVFNVAGQGYAAGSTVVNAGGLSGWNLCSNGLPGNVGAYGVANCPTGPPVSGTPTSGGAISGIPSNFQIVYAGSANIATTGAPVASVIYAPNAGVPITGAAVGYYGAVISSTFTEGSKAPVHFDNALLNSVFQVGPYKPVGFSWSKF
jgi:Tfp pilus assembly protein PilX